MLKAVNHAFSTILEHRSSHAFTREPHSDASSHAQVNHSFDGSLTRTQIDEMVAAIRHSESLLAIVFNDDIAGWRSRTASLLLAPRLYGSRVEIWRIGSSAVLVSHSAPMYLVPGRARRVHWHSHHEAITAIVRVVFRVGALIGASDRSRNHLAGHAVVAVCRRACIRPPRAGRFYLADSPMLSVVCCRRGRVSTTLRRLSTAESSRNGSVGWLVRCCQVSSTRQHANQPLAEVAERQTR